MADEFRHKDVVSGRITEDEYEAVAQHILNNGVDGEFVYWDTASGAFKRIAHQTDLDAHTRNILGVLKTGRYASPQFSQMLPGNYAILANRMYASPWTAVRAMTIDRIAIEVRIAGGGGETAYLGVYSDDGTVYPGNLVIDAGTVSIAGIAFVAATIAQALTKGLYWFVVLPEGNCSIYGDATAWSPIGTRTTGFIRSYGNYNVAQAHGALPAAFPGAAVNADGLHFVLPRILSLD